IKRRNLVEAEAETEAEGEYVILLAQISKDVSQALSNMKHEDCRGEHVEDEETKVEGEVAEAFKEAELPSAQATDEGDKGIVWDAADEDNASAALLVDEGQLAEIRKAFSPRKAF